MNSGSREPTKTCHVMAMPYPGRGHINPMMNLCKVLAAKSPNRILITFVLTREWLGFIGSDPKPDNMRFLSIPNVVPSELIRAADMIGFLKAVWTKMEAPFERLLDTEPPPSLILADTFLGWAVRVGNRRNIPVASFWTMSSSMYSFFHHFHLLGQNGHFPVHRQEKGEERVDYLPGISSTKISDLPKFIDGNNLETIHQLLQQFTWVSKSQYLLLPSIYELEPKPVDALAPNFSIPVYTIGPAIPHFNLTNSNPIPNHPVPNYLQWLHNQPHSSVLYVSLGSFLSASSTQMDEIAAGLLESGVRFLWVARDEACRLRETSGDMGLVVPWCDQLRVLSHCSVGGFLSHCGWNSVRESLFAGVPVLTYPLIADQDLNSKLIVEEWKVGWRMKKYGGATECWESTREEIVGLVRRFMDMESTEGKEMRRRVKGLREMCHAAVAKGGSSERNINSFIGSILE